MRNSAKVGWSLCPLLRKSASMQKKHMLVAISLAIACLTSCTSSQQEAYAPALIESISIRTNTVRVDRGSVERVDQLRGTVRIISEELSFGLASLSFGEYHVFSGDRVTKGQLLATLDTEHIDQMIEAGYDSLERIRGDYEHENMISEVSLSILRTELAQLNSSLPSEDESGSNPALMSMITAKSYEISRDTLLLRQAKERQELTLRYLEEHLESLRLRVADAELRAPFDGVITWIERKSKGDYIAPYEVIMYISDESTTIIELTERKFITSTMFIDLIIGTVGDSTYDLEWIPTSARDAMFYGMHGQTPPVRFVVANPDDNLTEGMYARVYMYNIYVEDVVRVPVDCVYSEPDVGNYVYIIENGSKVMRLFESGRSGTVFMEVISGLEEGDVVYVKQS